MDEQMNEGDGKFSKYNAGVAIQIRLDGLWKQVNQFCVAGNFKLWNATLDRIWSELARDIKQLEYDDKLDKDNKSKVLEVGYKNKYKAFDDDLAKLGNFEDDAKDSFKPLSKDQIENRSKQYRVLMEKDLFLKRLENHLGKGTAWDDHDEDDF